MSVFTPNMEFQIGGQRFSNQVSPPSTGIDLISNEDAGFVTLHVRQPDVIADAIHAADSSITIITAKGTAGMPAGSIPSHDTVRIADSDAEKLANVLHFTTDLILNGRVQTVIQEAADRDRGVTAISEAPDTAASASVIVRPGFGVA